MITMNFKNKNKTITQIVPATKSNSYLSPDFLFKAASGTSASLSLLNDKK